MMIPFLVGMLVLVGILTMGVWICMESMKASPWSLRDLFAGVRTARICGCGPTSK